MKNREELFNTLKLQISEPTPHKMALLFHHVHTLKLGDHYVLENPEDFLGLVKFLNEQEIAVDPLVI